MARKKKNEDPRVFNLKTKGTPELLNEVNRALASNDKDVPLKEVFSWAEESEEDQITRERAEDEAMCLRPLGIYSKFILRQARPTESYKTT